MASPEKLNEGGTSLGLASLYMRVCEEASFSLYLIVSLSYSVVAQQPSISERKRRGTESTEYVDWEYCHEPDGMEGVADNDSRF